MKVSSACSGFPIVQNFVVGVYQEALEMVFPFLVTK
jgi:hypothetical protein